jgi:hypothetical protein
MKAQAFELKPTGGKKHFAESVTGWEPRRAVGDLVRKIRHWNKRNDTYFETVHDADGKLLHQCEEPLSEHHGHGSAKAP